MWRYYRSPDGVTARQRAVAQSGIAGAVPALRAGKPALHAGYELLRSCFQVTRGEDLSRDNQLSPDLPLRRRRIKLGLRASLFS